jgi:hypothetical protein
MMTDTTTDWHWSDGTTVTEFPEKTVGFVYLITRKSDGKFYIGKKRLKFKRSKVIKGKKKRFEVDSDWRTYYGSSDALKEDVKTLGEAAFHREILHVCKSLSECSYRETEEIFARRALLREDCYNSWCSCKIHAAHVRGKLN